ncbi:MAG: trypsin-like peptidase domain-containing protein, partial [Pseudomonadota bacterium]
RFFGLPSTTQQRRENNAIGSGVIMNKQGFILTNAHVIKDSNDIYATLNDGRQVPAGIIGQDADTDLAILKIDLPNLPDIPIGNSAELNVGDVVLAIGNPYNFGQTVTQGIVSATSRKRRGLSYFDDFIQTDADINIGNSGGALINAEGELVGINTAIISSTGGSEGIGLATPINKAMVIMREIIENGEVIRGWLGVEVQTLDPNVVDAAGLENGGVLVTAVIRNSPADLAGLVPGDILLGIENIQTNSPDKAIETVLSLQPGNKVQLDILRGWEKFELFTKIQKRPVNRIP